MSEVAALEQCAHFVVVGIQIEARLFQEILQGRDVFPLQHHTYEVTLFVERVLESQEGRALEFDSGLADDGGDVLGQVRADRFAGVSP